MVKNVSAFVAPEGMINGWFKDIILLRLPNIIANVTSQIVDALNPPNLWIRAPIF